MDHERFVRDTFDALRRGDVDTVKAAFAPNARWRAVEDGPWNCEDRDAIMTVMAEQRTGSRGVVEDVFDAGDRIVVAFRPHEHDADDPWPLDDGIRYVVVTLDDDGLVKELKGCANRAVALEYAASG